MIEDSETSQSSVDSFSCAARVGLAGCPVASAQLLIARRSPSRPTTLTPGTASDGRVLEGGGRFERGTKQAVRLALSCVSGGGAHLYNPHSVLFLSLFLLVVFKTSGRSWRQFSVPVVVEAAAGLTRPSAASHCYWLLVLCAHRLNRYPIYLGGQGGEAAERRTQPTPSPTKLTPNSGPGPGLFWRSPHARVPRHRSRAPVPLPVCLGALWDHDPGHSHQIRKTSFSTSGIAWHPDCQSTQG